MGEVFFRWREKERQILNDLMVVVSSLILSICASIMTYIQFWSMHPLYKGLLSIAIILFSGAVAVVQKKFARFWLFVLLLWIGYIVALNTIFELFWVFILLALITLYYLLSRTKFFSTP